MLTEIAKNPFKLLNSYTKEDKDIFFGRDEEIDQLYNLVCRNRIVTVFGVSGTGKTSLVQCGLANSFDAADWFPLYIRRGTNLLSSIVDLLNENGVKINDQLDIPVDNELILNALVTLAKSKLRPLYLIFDQFEELLIIGDQTEKDSAIDLIQKILLSEELSTCNIIVTIREEYVGSLEPFIVKIPGFFEARLRLEFIKTHKVKDLINKSFKKFNIFTDDKTLDIIINTLNEESGISLPYMQVYLYQLWEADAERTDEKVFDDKGWLALQFTKEEVTSFGEMKDVLHRFLDQRIKMINDVLIKEPGYQPQMLNGVLDELVTKEGTKQPLEVYYDDKKILNAAPSTSEYLKKQIPVILLGSILSELELNRIIMQEKNYFELAHDKLAGLIFQKRSQTNQQKLEVIQLIENNPKRTTAIDNQLAKYDNILESLNLEGKYADYVNRSKKFRKYRTLAFIIIPILIALFVLLIQKTNLQRQNRQLLASDFFLSGKADSIADKKLILAIGHYFYTLDEGSNNITLKNSYYDLFRTQAIQSMLSLMHKTVDRSSWNQGDFEISSDGSFVVVRDTATSQKNSNYLLYDRSGNFIDSLIGKNYVYFLNHSNILLAAGTTEVPGSQSVYSGYYPNRFYLYDCSKKQRLDLGNEKDHAINLKNAYLYPKDLILLNGNNDMDSYRVTSDVNGNIIVPFYGGKIVDGGETLEKKVRVYKKDKSIYEFKCNSTLSLSKDRMSFLTITAQNKAEVRSGNGSVTDLGFASFGDFTKKGSVLLYKINKKADSVVLLGQKGKSMPVPMIQNQFSYMYADGDEEYLIMKFRTQGFLIHNFKTEISKKITEELIGVNFSKKSLISRPILKTRASDTVIYKKSFGGQELSSLSFKDRISKVIYNANSDNLMVLDSAWNLYLISDNFKIKSVYQLSTNDIFGFSGNGRYIYYIRDNSLNLLENKADMINLRDAEAADKWYKSTAMGKKKLSTALIKQYNLEY
ncbi:MAG: ATP-binding protein [Bacteroidota bacterium]